MSFLSLISIELKKIRRSKVLLLLFLTVVILWFPSVINADKNFEMDYMGISPEHNFLIQGFMGMAWFMIPAAFVICTVLLVQTEQSGSGIRKMLSLPVSTKTLCLAKFAVLILLAIVQMSLNIAAYYICAAIASQIQNYSFMLEPLYVFRTAGKLYLSAVPMAAVFWAAAVLISTPIFSIGIGLASIVPSVLMINTKFWFVYPMSYPFYLVTVEYSNVANATAGGTVQLLPWIPVAIVITLLGLAVSCFGFGYTERR